MPYYSHGTLLDIINRSSLTRPQREMFSGYVCLELLHLVKQLHQEAFILHADIKPDNIFIRAPIPFINSGQVSRNMVETNRVAMVRMICFYQRKFDVSNCLHGDLNCSNLLINHLSIFLLIRLSI